MTFIPPALAANPWLTHTGRLVEVIPECDGVATYRLRLDDPIPGAYAFEPGQFNMLYLPGVGESAISMSGDSEDADCWVHTVRVAGNVTRSLARLEPGQTLEGADRSERPGPSRILPARTSSSSRGSGPAPLRLLIYHVVRNRSQFGNVTVIVGARTSAGLLDPSEYAPWRSAGIDVQLTVDRATDDWNGNIGPVTTLLDRLILPRIDQACVVTCGPEMMMKYVALSALRRGIPMERVWVSMERNMQCAAGLCGHCQLGPAFICKDGPVMRDDQLRPDLFVESL